MWAWISSERVARSGPLPLSFSHVLVLLDTSLLVPSWLCLAFRPLSLACLGSAFRDTAFASLASRPRHFMLTHVAISAAASQCEHERRRQWRVAQPAKGQCVATDGWCACFCCCITVGPEQGLSSRRGEALLPLRGGDGEAVSTAIRIQLWRQDTAAHFACVIITTGNAGRPGAPSCGEYRTKKRARPREILKCHQPHCLTHRHCRIAELGDQQSLAVPSVPELAEASLQTPRSGVTLSLSLSSHTDKQSAPLFARHKRAFPCWLEWLLLRTGASWHRNESKATGSTRRQQNMYDLTGCSSTHSSLALIDEKSDERTPLIFRPGTLSARDAFFARTLFSVDHRPLLKLASIDFRFVQKLRK